MLGLLFQDILEPGHLVSDHAASFFGFEMVDFPFVVLDFLVDIFDFLLDVFGGCLGGLDRVLLLDAAGCNDGPNAGRRVDSKSL